MRWLNSFLLLLALHSVSAFATKLTVRTPAKYLDDRFTINVEFQYGKMKYVVPFFVDPNVKTSIFDLRQFGALAYLGKKPVWDKILISGYDLGIKTFKNGDAEEAFMPNFVRSCCYGILGQDILKDFQVVAFDDVPAYIEWFKIDPSTQDKPTFFVREKKFLWDTQTKNIFGYKFEAPSRRAFTTEKWNGIPKGSRWVRVQGVDPQYIDKYKLDRYLRGRIDQMLELEFEVGKEIKKVVHEFKWKNPT